MPEAAPYGSWRSPITAPLIAAGAVPLGAVELVGDHAYWLEGKPLEGGRYVLVRQSADGTRIELTPPGFNVRTRVHEYGGGAYTLHGRTAFFSNFADQRLYRQADRGEPTPITPQPEVPAGARYADGQVTPDGRLLVCVRELHSSDDRDEVVNELVAVPTAGWAPPRPIVGGHAFFSTPRISPDGRRLAWQAWDHPRMPWDGSEVWVGDLAADASVSHARRVAGGPEESIFQPAWSPHGVLHFVSDRTGWWNLYRVVGEDPPSAEPLMPMQAEFGVAQWVFGLGTYAFIDDGRIVCRYSRDGIDHLAFLTPNGELKDAEVPYTSFGAHLAAQGSRVALVGASPTEPTSVVVLNTRTGEREVLRRGMQHDVDPAFVSRPRPVEFPTEGGTAYALYYPPTNPESVGPSGERPPLLIESHGGPTSMARAELSLEVQFWTSRGFGLVDVNYGGSSGFGRAYRERLKGQWGIVDTQDCINAARFLAQQGEVDGRRLAIRGASAGGYTTLCGLVFHNDFAAGASYYGIADCEALATDTHKFESRYLDGLIGPYPEARDVYRARSPINFADRLSCPVILFQGLEDQVVPPSQAEEMVRALRSKGLPFAYLAFAGEQHGFRKADTIQRALEAELYFYSRVFGFHLSESVEPVSIENLDAPE